MVPEGGRDHVGTASRYRGHLCVLYVHVCVVCACVHVCVCCMCMCVCVICASDAYSWVWNKDF